MRPLAAMTSNLSVTSLMQDLERTLNDAGQQGWELAIQEQSLVCMKRPAAEPAPAR